MPLFTIRDTIPCHVTFLYQVQAESEDEARELFMEEIEEGDTVKAQTRLKETASELLEALIAVLPYARAEAEALESYRGDDDAVAQEADAAWKPVEQAAALLAPIPHTERRPFC